MSWFKVELDLTWNRYRKEILTSEELGKQLWDFTEQMIKEVEKEAAKKRAIERKKSEKEAPKPEAKPEPKIQDDEELIKMIEKAQIVQAKKEALEKLVAESEEQDKRDRAIAKLPEGVLDAPSRNTRSKTEELRTIPKVEEVKVEEPTVEATPAPRPDTPSRNTRRRTKKA